MSSTVSSLPPTVTLEMVSDQGARARAALAVRDVFDAAAMWRLCCTLSWLDVKLRYRGSILGPFWLTLSTGVMVGSMGFIYSTLFHMDLHAYLPFLALSIVLWGFLSSLISDACISFTSAEGMIRSVRMPYTLYAGRVVLRNLLVLGHNLVVIIVVDVLLSTAPGATALLAVPGFVLWLVLGLALSLLLGTLCARFRDIPPIIASIVQIAFFISAVIWPAEQLGDMQYLLTFNPFYTLFEVVRGPLLGHVPALSVYLSALVSSAVILIATAMLFSRVRSRIAFWV